MRLPRLALGSVAGLLLFWSSPAAAYYDDVHYALTYYIARRAGFTPQQALRIARANLSTDYSPPTEPVQKAWQKASLWGM